MVGGSGAQVEGGGGSKRGQRGGHDKVGGTDLRGAGTARELLPISNRQRAGARGCRVLGWLVVENIKVARVQRELRRGQVQARARRAGAALGWSDVQQAAA